MQVIKDELKDGILERKIKEKFLTFLLESDLVKFAKYIPPLEKPENDWQVVYNLVKETIPQEPKIEEVPKPNAEVVNV